MKRYLLLIISLLPFISSDGRQPKRGYRGFLEWSNDLTTTASIDGKNSMSTFYTGFSTSHGYQVNSWLFAGAGLEYEHCSKIDSNILAPFLHGRTDLKFGSFTPYGDIRLGYNLAGGGGVFFSPNVGYRFNWGRKTGINIGAGVSVTGYKVEIFDIGITPDGYMTFEKTGENHRCKLFFSFRIGFDF